MRIAVVGGGIFGCTAAIHAARAGHDVHLFERAGALMQAASGINQLRLHEGFHYPRSPDTVRECQAALRSFRAEYRAAVVDSVAPQVGGSRQFYVIAKGSRTSRAAYAAFCRGHGLYYRMLAPQDAPVAVRPGPVEAIVSVNEPRIDVHELRSIVVRRIDELGISVHYASATPDLRADFDTVVIAAYAATNDVVADLGLSWRDQQPYQFEVVEKPVVGMPPAWEGVGVVVIDGEFGCVDPYARTGFHLLGHVKHAIHAANIGLWPVVPPHLALYLNRGIVARPRSLPGEPPASRFEEIRKAGTEFIPDLDRAAYIGSMYTIRAVLPDREATDARPTLVERLDEQVVRIFSGKIGTAVVAAQQALGLIEERKREAA